MVTLEQQFINNYIFSWWKSPFKGRDHLLCFDLHWPKQLSCEFCAHTYHVNKHLKMCLFTNMESTVFNLNQNNPFKSVILDTELNFVFGNLIPTHAKSLE